ncbi:hypothetical protein V8J88_18275 [Massilia sp. W12]|uniref:hypothetical protein n=1 Tax=Massilia sp. W12 TaxID=3126507 RepID=UPI0030CC9CF9
MYFRAFLINSFSIDAAIPAKSILALQIFRYDSLTPAGCQAKLPVQHILSVGNTALPGVFRHTPPVDHTPKRLHPGKLFTTNPVWPSSAGFDCKRKAAPQRRIQTGASLKTDNPVAPALLGFI